MPLRTTLVAAALAACALAVPAALLAPAAAVARRPSGVRWLEFDVSIRGRQRVVWQDVSREWPRDDAFWEHGSGEQIGRYRTATPMRVTAVDYRGMPRFRATRGLPRLVLGGVVRYPRLSATLRRVAAVTEHSPPPACEGCGELPSRTEQVPQQCGTRRIDLAFDSSGFRYAGGKLTVIPRIRPGSRPYEQCAPDAGYVFMGSGESLLVDGMFWVAGIRGVDAIFDLRRGASRSFSGRDDYQDGRCRLPSPPIPGEFSMCYWNEATVTFTRVK